MPRAAIYVAGAALLRLFCIVWYRIDSDEPQHLHVAWAWTQGLIPYRNFYENHLPLFHVLFSPIVAAVGETPRVLLISRFVILPISVASLAVLWMIAARVYDRTVAFWAMLFAAVFPPLLLKNIEVRNDSLWTLLVLVAVALVLRGWMFWCGIVLGLALLTSIKTLPFAFGLAVAVILLQRARAPRSLAVMAIAALLPVAAATTWLLQQDALDDLWRNAIVMNGMVAVEAWRRIGGLIVLAGCLGAAIVLRRQADADRALVAITTIVGIGAIFAISPLISPRDFLPHFCLAAIFAAERALRSGRKTAPVIVAILAIANVPYGDLHQPQDDSHRLRIEQSLQITTPQDFVFDIKGELLFRHRPTFMTFERVGREMIERGIVPETAPEDLVRHRCYVATGDLHLFPPRTLRFIEENYIEWGALRVAGSRVRADGTYRIAIPGEYRVVDAKGRELEPPRFFAAGTYRLARSGSDAFVVWSRLPSPQRAGTSS